MLSNPQNIRNSPIFLKNDCLLVLQTYASNSIHIAYYAINFIKIHFMLDIMHLTMYIYDAQRN